MSHAHPVRFVFSSLEHPKRIAKLLHKRWLSSSGTEWTLATAQEALAKMCGHPSWHALAQATKQKQPPSLFDEDVPAEVVGERMGHQILVLAREYGFQPQGHPPAADEAERPFEDPMMLYARRSWRIAELFNVEMAWAVVREIAPTARARPRNEPFTPSGNPDPLLQTERLATGLSRWFTKHIPYQDGVARSLEEATPNTSSTRDMLVFLHYWGELCHHYANTIPLPVQAFGLLCCATRLGLLEARYSAEVRQIFEAPAADRQQEVAWQAWEHKTILRFLRTQLRTDLAEVWEKQPGGLMNLAVKGGRTVSKLWR